jgi:pyrroline-5-carboxylate reductase
MRLGFIGTGALTSAIVTGLKSAGDNSVPVVLSPHNEEIAVALASQYADVRVATDNQSVLDECDTVMLAVRPQMAHAVLGELKFRGDHHVVSLIATVSRDGIAALVAPADHVTKALPMPMIAERLGSTIIYPPDAAMAAFFGALGKVIEADDPAAFDALSVVTATFATYFKYLETIQAWLKTQGIADDQARAYVSTIYHALAHAPVSAPDIDFVHLAREYATRGGINEQVVRELTAKKVFETFAESLDTVHRRITGS